MTLKITVDTRESAELYHEICRIFPDIEFERKKLDDGDYWAESKTNGGLVLVERKTISDFYTSVMSKEKQKNGRSRMANEVDSLTTHENEFVLFLLIGSITEYHRSMLDLEIPVNTSIIYGEVASLMTREHFHILWGYNEKDARIMMVQFMRAVHNGKYGVPARRDPVKQMARILRITPNQLIQLLNKFNSIQNLSNQKPEDLESVHGIGPSRAQFILDMLNGKLV